MSNRGTLCLAVWLAACAAQGPAPQLPTPTPPAPLASTPPAPSASVVTSGAEPFPADAGSGEVEVARVERPSGASACIFEPNWPEIVQGRIRAKNAKLRACYEEGLSRLPGLKGTVAVKFAVSSSGKVSGVEALTTSTLADTKVKDCVCSVIATLRLPEPTEAGSVSLQLAFAPNGG